MLIFILHRAGVELQPPLTAFGEGAHGKVLADPIARKPRPISRMTRGGRNR